MACVDNVQLSGTCRILAGQADIDMIEFICKHRADCMQTEHTQTHGHIRNNCMGITHCAMR